MGCAPHVCDTRVSGGGDDLVALHAMAEWRGGGCVPPCGEDRGRAPLLAAVLAHADLVPLVLAYANEAVLVITVEHRLAWAVGPGQYMRCASMDHTLASSSCDGEAALTMMTTEFRCTGCNVACCGSAQHPYRDVYPLAPETVLGDHRMCMACKTRWCMACWYRSDRIWGDCSRCRYRRRVWTTNPAAPY